MSSRLATGCCRPVPGSRAWSTRCVSGAGPDQRHQGSEDDGERQVLRESATRCPMPTTVTASAPRPIRTASAPPARIHPALENVSVLPVPMASGASVAHIHRDAGVTQVHASDPLLGREAISIMKASATGTAHRHQAGNRGTGRSGTRVRRLGIGWSVGDPRHQLRGNRGVGGRALGSGRVASLRRPAPRDRALGGGANRSLFGRLPAERSPLDPIVATFRTLEEGADDAVGLLNDRSFQEG